MSGPENETLTAALRRLADEHASGLLSVATPGRDVLVELDAGVPVSMGPVHDVNGRVGEGAPEELVRTAVLDELVDRTVAAIVAGEAHWEWDVTSDADLVPVPAGLVDELARRAVDAAQALAGVAADEVLLPGHDVETHGEVDRVRRLFDGERSLLDVADAADMTVAAVATIAAALLDAGALTTDEDEDDEPDEEPSWIDTVKAAGDDEDDEPELWVMEAPEDDLDEEEDEPAPTRGFSPRRDWSSPAASSPAAGEPADEEPAATVDDDEDDLFVAPPEDDLGFAAPEEDEEPEVPAGAPVGADGGGWNDTGWLDDLEDPVTGRDRQDDAPPVLAAGDDTTHDARAALSSMLHDMGDDSPPRTADAAAEPADDEDAAPAATDADAPAKEPSRKEPKAEPGEVAEFLRELSRLALDDD